MTMRSLMIGFAMILGVGCGNSSDTESSSEKTSGTEQSTGDPCLNEGTEGASATCLKPTQTAEYYVAQANKYFDTLDTDADPDSIPNYSAFVVRWEWPPWLLLTGYGKQDMIDSGKALKVLDPSTVPERDCRAFDTQPFARCIVSFTYEGGPCPIYEEFTFNDEGEMTFIEAWSYLPSNKPQTDESDLWGEKPGTIDRLSTRVPGLGNSEGLVDWDSQWIKDASVTDEDVADLAERTTDWRKYWWDTVGESPKDFFAQGCGW